MGSWEQIGEANRRHRERRAQMNPKQRAIRDAAGGALLVGAAVALWTLVLTPLALSALRAFFW
mgnify:CR=1 FL=1|jgi:hypothetical protein